MAKTLVFVRGVDSAARRTVVKRLMQLMNPDINTTRAIRLSLSDYVQDPSDKGAMKAADKTLKNLVKKVLMTHTESHVVIDNENLLPIHWQSFVTAAETIGAAVSTMGIEVPADQDVVDAKKKNLQEVNHAEFISDMGKYIDVKINDLDDFDRQVIKAL